MTGDTVTEKIKIGWDKSGVGAYAALAMLLALACGYSFAGWQAQKNMVALVEQHRIEREQMTKANKVQIDYFRREIRKKNIIMDKQSDQIAEFAKKGVDAAKASSELGQQILEGTVK